MEQSNAHFRISLESGTFEVSGSEKFVQEQMDKFAEAVDDIIDKLRSHRLGSGSDNPGVASAKEAALPSKDQGGQADQEQNPYPNVIVLDEDKVRVIAEIPGANAKEKTINAALICLIGKGLLGANRATFKEIRDICKDQAFLDSSNFSQYLRTEKSLFTVHGKGGGNLEAQLTFPGRKSATELVEQLNDA